MGGLGFIHLGFLAAGAAVAVPIVIHLLFRHRPRLIDLDEVQIDAVGLHLAGIEREHPVIERARERKL